MSFQEKNIGVSLTNFTIILVYFLIRISRLINNGLFLPEQIYQLWLTVIVFSVVATVAGTVLTHVASSVFEAMRTGDQDPQIEDIQDERDKLIDLRGTKLTYTIYSMAVFGAMLSFVLGQPGLVMFTALIGSGIIAQLVGDVYRIALYRRGI